MLMNVNCFVESRGVTQQAYRDTCCDTDCLALHFKEHGQNYILKETIYIDIYTYMYNIIRRIVLNDSLFPIYSNKLNESTLV
jgi:hypothetical protein